MLPEQRYYYYCCATAASLWHADGGPIDLYRPTERPVERIDRSRVRVFKK